MWSRLSTVEVCRPCTPPFSFYFDVIDAYWRAKTDPLPLHRACTLGRKQGATYCVVASAFERSDIIDEIDDLDASFGGGGAVEALAIAFFRTEVSPEAIDDVSDGALLGQVTVINYREPGKSDFTQSYIYEAVFKPPALANGMALLNNFVCHKADFTVRVSGRDFTLSGIYYCQQNERTNVCAHASLRMALNSTGVLSQRVTNRAINSSVNLDIPIKSGLQIGQLQAVINHVPGIKAVVYPCQGLSPATYIANLTSVVESGNLALLAFSTGDGEADHVVTVFGHTRNSDEWHPQAIPAYTGPSSGRYYASSAWVDHFLIHDDNFGPYYTLSTRALEVDPKMRPICVIAVQAHEPNAPPAFAEGVASFILANLLPGLAGERSEKWFEYITRRTQTYVLRTLLVSKANYLAHISGACGHDGGRYSQADIDHFAFLPEFFWMVEFSLPALYTGNNSKLGEILLDANKVADPKKPETLFLGMRMPSLILTAEDGSAALHESAFKTHCPIFSVMQHPVIW